MSPSRLIQAGFALTTALASLCAASMAAHAQSNSQQRQSPMIFFDQRRLPDMEVERRNQEVIIEQRRADEQRRTEAEAAERNKASASRLAAEAQREAQRKIDEANQLAEAATAKKEAERKNELDKKAQAEAETKRKIEEDKQRAATAEAETMRKAEEARLAADAKRKADEEKQLAAQAAAEAETKRKAEEARLAAETKRAAELAKLAADAAEARRKADDARLAASAAAASAAAVTPEKPAGKTAALIAPPANQQPTDATSAAKPSANTAKAGCASAKTGVTSLPAGRMQLAIQSACRVNEPVTITYGDVTLLRRLDGTGTATVLLEQIFGPTESVTLRFVDGSTAQLSPSPLPPSANSISKVAIIWEKNVDLNLHALEAGATIGKPGHVWAGANARPEAVDAIINEAGRGAGWISTVDDGSKEGAKMEVYTFIHSPEQTLGVVAMVIEHASRGSNPPPDMCGSGALAEVPFEVVLLDNKGQVSRENGIIPASACGQPVGLSARYLQGAVPDLRIRR